MAGPGTRVRYGMGIILLPIILLLVWWFVSSFYRLVSLGVDENSFALPLKGLAWAAIIVAPVALWYFTYGRTFSSGYPGLLVGKFWGGIAGLPFLLAVTFSLIKDRHSPLHRATSYAGGVLTPLFASAVWMYEVGQPGFHVH